MFESLQRRIFQKPVNGSERSFCRIRETFGSPPGRRSEGISFSLLFQDGDKGFQTGGLANGRTAGQDADRVGECHLDGCQLFGGQFIGGEEGVVHGLGNGLRACQFLEVLSHPFLAKAERDRVDHLDAIGSLCFRDGYLIILFAGFYDFDNVIVLASSPKIVSPITEGRGVINGSFTQEAANALAVTLNTKGPLPIPLVVKQVSENGEK